MAAERLTPFDSHLLRLEAAGHHCGLVGLTICEGPVPTASRVRERVERLLPSVPRFAAVPQTVPLDVERPVWADVASFTAGAHIHAEKLKAQRGRDAVAELVQRLADTPFDPSRPRWDFYVVDGLPRKQWLLAAHLHLACSSTACAPPTCSRACSRPGPHRHRWNASTRPRLHLGCCSTRCATC